MIARKCAWAVLICLAIAGKATSADVRSLDAVASQGESLSSVFSELNQRGYRITYSSAVVSADMKVVAAPKSHEFEQWIAELLQPWGLRALKTASGDYLIVRAEAVEQRSNIDERGERSEHVATPLETVDVAATRFGIAGEKGASTTVFSETEVQQMPHLADDAMRVLKTLPGAAGGDLSAKVNVRGGRRDEVLTLVEGAEIHNAFHFHDDDGIISIVDTNLVRSIDFTTGGMTADQGEYMSGVVDIAMRRPAPDDDYRSALGISFIGAFARTSGMFAEGKGSWLASARRSYMDLLMDEVQEGDDRLNPEYQDAYTAVRYELSDRTSVAAHLLLSTDDLLVVEGDESQQAGEAEASHLWTTIDHRWTDDLDSRTVIAWATGDRQRDNFDTHEGFVGSAAGNTETGYLDLRQDWTWLSSPRNFWKWGLSASRHEAQYQSRLDSVAIDPIDSARVIELHRRMDLDISGEKYGVYAAYRTQLLPALVVELGGRWDHYAYEEDVSFTRVSPRVNLVYAVAGGSLRAAWGVIHQPQGVDQLQVEDGLSDIFQPERVDYASLGYSRSLWSGLDLRFDIYRKMYSDLHPRFENQLDSIRLIPEAEADRIRIDATRARAQGAEISLRRATFEQWGGWLGYGYSQAEDDENHRWVPRSWHQRHTVSFGLGRASAKWAMNLTGLYHSGAPTTEIRVVPIHRDDGSASGSLALGERNAGRLDDYLRFDLRVSRTSVLSSGVLTYYLEVFNLLDRMNPCCVDGIVTTSRGNTPVLSVEYSDWFPRLPSFGFQFEF